METSSPSPPLAPKPCCGTAAPVSLEHRATAPTSRDEPFTIRPAASADLPAVYTLLAEAALPGDGVEEQFGDQYAVAVSARGDIVGVEGFEVYGRHALLRSAAVSEAWRGRGIGAALTRDRIEAARARGLVALWGLTTTAAEYFPRKFGLAVVPRNSAPPEIAASREFASVCPSTATTLYLELQGAALSAER